VRSASGSTRGSGSTSSGSVAPGLFDSPFDFYPFTLCRDPGGRNDNKHAANFIHYTIQVPALYIYNTERLHESLGYRTPQEVYFGEGRAEGAAV